MENKILQLLMEKGKVSMNNDIFPILFGEFGAAPLNESTYATMSDFIKQQLIDTHCAGCNIISVPQFSGIPHTGTLFVSDVVYEIVR